MHGPAGDSSTFADGDEPVVVACWLAPSLDGAAAELERLVEQLPAGLALCVGVRAEHSPGLTRSTPSAGRTILEVAAGEATTLAAIANAAHRRWAAADLILLSSAATLPDGWLERLRDAAASESSTATVSALPSGLLDRRGWSPARAAVVGTQSRRLYPRIPGAIPPCVYVRASALDLVGPLDESLPTSDAAALSFSFGGRERGLANLLADDLLIDDTLASSSIAAARDALGARAQHAEMLAAAELPPEPALARSVALASTTGERLSVTIDARALGPGVGGTQEYVLALICALAQTNEVRLRTLVAPDLSAPIEAQLRALPACELLSYEAAVAQTDASDVVHRPQQVFSADDLTLLRPLGRRLVITHHDLIAYHNPVYFESHELWQRYVRTTRGALGAADHVIFFSRYVRGDAERDDLIDERRTSIAYLGAGSGAAASDDGRDSPTPPTRAAGLDEAPFMLCIGADYLHKNRPFAIAVLDELRRRHRWPGKLVLAGPHVANRASSREQERRVREERGVPGDLVIDLSTVSDGERTWLARHARAIVYPTVQEGFGLVPFEAAATGVPCLFAAQSSLAELLDAELAALVPWDAARSADRAIGLLEDGRAREDHVLRLQAAAAELRWSECADATVEAYREAVASPYRSDSELAWQALEREHEIVRLDLSRRQLSVRVRELSDDLGEDAEALVGKHALLSREDQHVLLAVAARPTFRRLLFGALRKGFSAMRALRRSQA
jgi:glycosyltransferase involved in cell wall biosynthesis